MVKLNIFHNMEWFKSSFSTYLLVNLFQISDSDIVADDAEIIQNFFVFHF